MNGEKWLPCAERTWPLGIQGRPQLPVIGLGQVCFEHLQGAPLQAPLLPALRQGTALKGMASQELQCQAADQGSKPCCQKQFHQREAGINPFRSHQGAGNGNC